MAQRLLRAVCPHCAEPHEATAQELAWLRQVRAFNGIDEANATPVASVSGRGCAECHGTGYHGRVGVYEMLEIDPDMALAIQRNDAGAFPHPGAPVAQRQDPGRPQPRLRAAAPHDARRGHAHQRGCRVNYAWRGRNKAGELIQGVVDAPTVDAVAAQLMAGGVIPIAIDVAAEGATPAASPIGSKP